MIEILTSAVGVMLLAVSAVLLGALVVFLPDLIQEGMPRLRREVVLVLTWASALGTALVSLMAGWALVTALKLEEAPLPRPTELPARTEATVPETTSNEGTIPEFTSDRTGSPSAASSSSASPSAIPSPSTIPSSSASPSP